MVNLKIDSDTYHGAEFIDNNLITITTRLEIQVEYDEQIADLLEQSEFELIMWSLRQLAQQRPALYMRAVTKDMLIKYT